jgi:hypothetical protein
MAALAAACCFLSWKALDNAIACQHTSVDREVAAYHESTHGSVLLGQNIGFVCEICLIFTAIDKDQASVAIVVPVTLVHGVCPSSTPAEALEVLHIEAAHCGVDAGGVHLMGKGGRSGSRCGCYWVNRKVEIEVYKSFSGAAKIVERIKGMRGEVDIKNEYQWRKRAQNKRLSRSKREDWCRRQGLAPRTNSRIERCSG